VIACAPKLPTLGILTICNILVLHFAMEHQAKTANEAEENMDTGDRPLRFAKQEAFAQARARGLTKTAASDQAGYKKLSTRSTNTPAVLKRIDWLSDHLKWGGSRDLGPVIDEMRRVAKGTNLGPAAAAREIKELLIEIARLKEKLPIGTGAAIDPLDEDISEAEWLRLYGAKD
jgi:hypothetical protein